MMFADELSSICSRPRLCGTHADVHMQDGHFFTTILPLESFTALGNMGAKYRPNDCRSYLNPESRSAILEVMRSAVAQFAKEAEARVNAPACMTA